MIYPPYCDIAAACFSGEDRRTTEDAAKEFLNLLKFAVTDDYKDIKIITLGSDRCRRAKGKFPVQI